jgi:microcompartment protein CcmL/EutN
MVKVADASLCRFSIGSGGRIVALVTGNVDEVAAAMEAGTEAAKRVGGFVAARVVSSADPQVIACFGGAFDARMSPSGEAMGLLETRSTVGLVKAMDRMLKTANVAFEGNYKVGYFLTASVIRGDVSSVRAALEVGAQEAAKFGEIAGVHLIPHPYGTLEERMPHR